MSNKVLWLTGLPCSGKTTLAQGLSKKLTPSYILDGDNVRKGLNGDLGFSKKDRDENIRRVIEVAKLFHDAKINIIVSFISPYREMRERARKIIGKDFIEVSVNCPLEVCERRDVKGMYQKARAGEITEFTGVSAPYEKPINPEIIVDTDKYKVEYCVNKIIKCLEEEQNKNEKNKNVFPRLP